MEGCVSAGRGAFKRGATTRQSSIAAAHVGQKHKNLAAEPIAKLLNDEIKQHSQLNVVQSRAFSEILQKDLTAYHNRAFAAQEVIDELIQLAKEIQADTR